jgi:hypothetical protein
MSRTATKVPRLTLEITSASSKVQVYGKRSTKGWTVKRVDGARADFQGHRKSKEEAIQLALDCCEPGLKAVFSVRPAG